MSTQQTYEQRVRALAEEMYTALYPKHANTTIYSSVDAAFHGQEAECLTMELLPAARIAVKRMAGVLKDLLKINYQERDHYVIQCLEQFGLIPDQEDGDNETL